MIRRVILFRDITEADAVAATAMAKAMGDGAVEVSYRPVARPMRLLLFDAMRYRDRDCLGTRRFAIIRIIGDPAEPASAAMREAADSGDVVFNVYTGHESDRSTAYSDTDAVFTVALPTGEAVAWFARVGGGIAPGIAVQCVIQNHQTLTALGFSAMQEWNDFRDGTRFLFFKRQPPNLREHQVRVILFAENLLAEMPIGRDV